MAADNVASVDGTLLASRTRTGGPEGSVEVPEGVTDFLDGSGIPQPVSASNPFPVYGVGTFSFSGTVAVAASALPSGASTEATLSTVSSTLTSINTKITAVNTGAVVVSSSALPTGAATEATLSALNTKVTAVNTGAVVISSSVLPTGASTEATLSALNTKVTAVNTGAVVISSGTITAVTAITNALPAGTNVVGKFTTDRTTPGQTNLVAVAGPDNAVASLTNPVPTTMAALYYPSSGSNNTAAQLGAGATFTGTAETIVNQQAAQVTVVCDQPYTVIVEQFQDAGATKKVTVDATYTFTRTAGVPLAENVTLVGNYFRLKVTNNGGSTTTTLSVDVTFGIMPTQPYALTNLGNQKSSLNEISGVAVTLGQKTMATSVPVVLASDQAAIPVTGTFSATTQDNVNIANGNITVPGLSASWSTSGFQIVGFDLQGLWAGSVIIMGSDDGTVWYPLQMVETTTGYTSDDVTAPGHYYVRPVHKNIAINTQQISGTLSYRVTGRSVVGYEPAMALLSQAMDQNSGVQVSVYTGFTRNPVDGSLLVSVGDRAFTAYLGSSGIFVDTLGFAAIITAAINPGGGSVGSVAAGNSILPTSSGQFQNISGVIPSTGTWGTSIGGSTAVIPCVGRYIKLSSGGNGWVDIVLKVNSPWLTNTPVNINQIGGTAAAQSGGALRVVGNDNQAGIPASVLIHGVGGWDGTFMRRLLTDTSGRLSTNINALPIPATQSPQNVTLLPIQDQTLDRNTGMDRQELLYMILTELKIHSTYLYELSRTLQSPQGLASTDDPATLRNNPTDLD